MTGALEVSGDIAAAATALGGLILVFLGSIAASYAGFEPSSQSAVRDRYKRRAMLALLGFFASLIAATAALCGKWVGASWLVDLGFCALLVSLLVISVAATLVVKDID